MKKIASYALGCKVNQYESEAIAELFAEKGYEVVSVDDEADVYIINTCTVTNFGDKKSRQLIRKVKRQNENAIVAVVGCYAQTAPEELAAVHGVNLVIGTKDKSKIVELVEDYQAEQGVQNYVTDIMHERVFEPLEIKKLANRTRAYLKIQDGCSQFCSYCIIPYARGPIRSRQPEDVIAEVKRLAENGFKEVVTEEFAAAMAELPKVCDHFHLSLQSGCDKTLKEMNRKYDTEKYRQAAALLRKYLPDVAITTDIIVGFPGETEEDYQASRAFAEEIGFSKIHVFPYSPKKGTPAAARKDQLQNAVKQERSHDLITVSDRMTDAFLQKHVGKVMPVLFERCIGDDVYEGHTTNYMKVHARSTKDLSNVIADTKILSVAEEMAFGEVEA